MNLQLIIEKDERKLSDFNSKIRVTLKSFDLQLIRLNADDFLPRYNRIIVTIENYTSVRVDDLLLTITRTGSKIGPDNFDILPIKTYGLDPNEKGIYELKAFDPFNEKFENIEIRLATMNDWENRRKVDNWLKKAGEFAKRIDSENFKIT